MTAKQHTLKVKDVAEIGIGSLLLAFPLAVTEEVWNLSEELTMLRAIMISFASLVVISIFVYTAYDHDGVFPRRRDFYFRVVATYVVTFLVCVSILAAIDRLDLFTNTGVALKRTVIVAFPASFAATVVDSIL